MAFDLSAASSVLKTFYLPPVREMLNNSTVLLSRLDKDSSTQDVTGTSFTVPLHKSRNTGAGIGIAENGTLPTAGNQGYGTAVVPNKYVYGRITVSGPAIAAMKNNAGAFVRAVDSELKGCTKDMQRAMNRQLHGDGRDALAFWTSADNTSGTVVDDENGYAFTHLPDGQTITCDLVDTDNTTLNGTAIVVTLGSESTSPVGYNATWTGTVSGSGDGDYLVQTGTLGYQMMGIAGVINDTDVVIPAGGGTATGLQGLAVSSNTFWKAKMQGSWSSKVDLSFPLMQKVISKIASGSDYNEKDIKFLLCSYAMRDKYVELCVNERRFYNTMTLDGGFEAVDFNGKPLIPDPQCKHGVIYFVTPDSLKLFRTSDFDWMDKDGSVFSRVANKDQYEATLFHYGDLGCIARNANGALIGINE